MDPNHFVSINEKWMEFNENINLHQTENPDLPRLFTNFLNGIGKLQLSIYSALFTITMNIPLSIFFARYMNLGISGVILATNVSILLTATLRWIQYHKIMNRKATGIWNK